jgi:predicted  nucleic acid-binding Zn-ribbon protein
VNQILQRRSSELNKELPALMKRKERAEKYLKKMKEIENNFQASESKLEGLTL